MRTGFERSPTEDEVSNVARVRELLPVNSSRPKRCAASQNVSRTAEFFSTLMHMTASSGGSPTLRELREAAGVSLGQIVRATDYSKGHLSKVENGLRPASPRLVRVYESLHERPPTAPIPMHSPRSAEAERPIAASYGGEIRRARSALGLSQRDLASLAGLSHVYVSKIENGKAMGTPYVAGLLDRRLGQNGALLRLFRAEAGRVPAPVLIPHVAALAGLRPARPPKYVETVLAEATAWLERVRLRRHLAGPAAVVNDVVTHVADLHATAEAVPVKPARKLRQMEARYAEYLSWLAEELGDTAAMRDWLALAVQLGSDNGDTAIAGYAAIRQSATALRANRPDAALLHVQCALSNPALPLRLRRIALQRESRARARIGDREGFSRTMQTFYELADDQPAQSAEQPEWGPIWDAKVCSSRLTEASGLLELEEFRRAAEVFATAMPHAFPDGHESTLAYRHAWVCFSIREATAYAHVHECDRAADVIESFLPIMPMESITVRRDLRRLASILSRRRAPRLQSLAPDIITLAQTVRRRSITARLEASDA